MAILPIVTYNDEVLRKKTKSVTIFDDALHSFIDDLFETMYNSEGIGLAAPQVGRSIRIFVIDADSMQEEEEEPFGPTAFINPVIIAKNGAKIAIDEGCLSIPGVSDKVFRPEEITIKYINERFEEEERTVGGWISRVIQHEYDHLEGILFIDYLSVFRKRMHKADLEEIENGLRETKYPVLPKSTE